MLKDRARILLSTSILLVVIAAGAGAADALAANGPRPVVRYATRSDTTAPLRELPAIPPMPPVLGEIFEQRPPKLLPNRQGSGGPSGPDPALQSTEPEASAPTSGSNFEGIDNVNSVLPPDTNGDIGPNHYVQMVNLSFAIWDRSGNLLYGPVDNNTLWQGFGGPCETTNHGDPIVLYDELADRWMLSQFALPRFPRGPFYQCIAVSQTADPLGQYHRYEFTVSSDKLNDYPKFGVWTDGYYMAVNQFKCNVMFCNWAGQGVGAFERDQMLAGGPARMVYFDLFNVDSNLGGMLPSDLDGPVPPAGALNSFAQVDDDAWGYSPDQLQIWEFDVDWADPTASTFSLQGTLPVASFDSNLCGYSRNCIPQPGGTNVDAISDRLMYRLQYRNFGGHQTLVVNHTVDATGNDRAGVRWYELRDTGSGWGIQQQGTYSPDSDHRWMGSVAMNSAGDIALGFSVSSTNVFPSIRVTGRLAEDIPGNMTQGELPIVDGSGYQQHSSGRWGDYSMMAVDPVDDCTFWYTQEYYQVAGNAPWQTRIGAFKLRECGPTDSPPTVSITNPADDSTVSGTIMVAADASDDKGVTQVEFFVGDGLIGIDTDGSNGWSANWDTTAYEDGSHTVSATATDTIGQTATHSVTVNVDNPTPGGIHVGDLDGNSINNGSSWTAVVTITIHDSSHNPVANATVTGSWSGPVSSVTSCLTGADGTCQVSATDIHKRNASVTFTVDDVTGSLTYDSGANHDPDSDSDGTSVVVSKP